MRRAERVVFALGALGETGKAAALTQGAKCGRAGRSGSCGDRPDGPTSQISRSCGRVENVMQRDSQFHDAKTGAQDDPPVTATALMVSAREASAAT